MKEKLVENWLIRSSERAYQGPLCAVLSYEGYNVLHSTRHCSMEMGKDIIAHDAGGDLVCFQLKAHKGKRLTLSEWRSDLQQQIYPLVMGKVVHPSVKKSIHKSVVVITGYLDEEVSNEIQQFNQGQIDSGYPNRKIDVWTIGDLSSMFAKHLGKLGPDEPEDVKLWLELFLDGGHGLPDKDKFFILFNTLLKRAQIDSPTKAKAFVSHNIVIAGSIASQYAQEDNFVAEIEIWLCAYLQTVYVQNKFAVANKDQEIDRAIILEIVRNLLSALCLEIGNRGRFSEFDEMHELFEQQFAPMVGALIALHILIEDTVGNMSLADLDAKLNILERALNKAKLASEISIVYLLLIDLILMKFGRTERSIENLYGLHTSLLHLNNVGEYRLPSPKYDLETIFLWRLGEDLESNLVDDNFDRSSFTLRALILFLTSLNARKILEDTWKTITRFTCNEYIPDDPLDVLARHSLKGVNWTYILGAPQKWSDLISEAEVLSKGAGLPQCLKDNATDLFILLVSQPYRITAEIVCHLNKTMALPQLLSKKISAAQSVPD